MRKQSRKSKAQTRAKTTNTNHKQPTNILTEPKDNQVDNEALSILNVNVEELTKLWLHGLTSAEIAQELGIHVQTVRVHVRKIEEQYKELPVGMLKSKATNTILKLLLDSDLILRRYSIELGRLDNGKDNTNLDRFITIAKALESQAKTLTDCLVRMGVVQTSEKGKGTQYPHSSTDNNFEELDKAQTREELIAYHERRARALKRNDTKQNKEVESE